MSSMLMSNTIRWTAVAAITVLLPALETIARADAPSGQELIKKFVDLSGGPDAYAKIQNRVIKADLDLSDHGMEGEIVEIFAPPNYRREIVLDVYDVIVTGITNGVPWRFNADDEPIPLKGAEAADIKRHAQLNPFLGWTPASGEAKVTGDAKMGEDECYRVEIAPAEGSPLRAFFSKKTGLLRRIDNETANIYRYFGDYRKQDGVLVPYVLRFEAGMWMANYENVNIEQNVNIEDITFDEPTQTEAASP